MKYVPEDHLVHSGRNAGHEVVSYPDDYAGFRRIMSCPEMVALEILKMIGYTTASYGMNNKEAIRIDFHGRWPAFHDWVEGHRNFCVVNDDSRFVYETRMYLYKHDFTVYFMTWNPFIKE